jgi:hypothetical protein
MIYKKNKYKYRVAGTRHPLGFLEALEGRSTGIFFIQAGPAEALLITQSFTTVVNLQCIYHLTTIYAL